MLFRNAIRLLVENFKNVYKIALYKIVVSLVSSALVCALVLPQVIDLWNSAVVQDLISGLGKFFTSLFSADANGLDAAKESIFESVDKIGKLLSSKTVTIVLVTLGCVLLYLLRRFVETLCYFAVGGVLNDKMTTYAETPFFTSFVANLGRASKYALVYVPVVFLFDLLTLGLTLLILANIPIVMGLFLGMTVIVAMQALKLTVTGLWLPAMTADKLGIKKALRAADGAEKKQRWKIYATYIVTVYIVIILNVMAAVCTFGSAMLITVPASFMLFICLQFVYYYTVKGKKYFITYERIASNPDKGDREHYFDYIDETVPKTDEEQTGTEE